MRVINIVDRLDKVNYGIYNAAVFTAEYLRSEYGIASEVWFPETEYNLSDLNGCKPVPLKDTSTKGLKDLLKSYKLDLKNDIIVTHGCWRFPTRWGNVLKKKGFRWIYVPHGMLEPWSIKEKRLKKSAYLRWFEVPAARNADYVRAVGSPERERLKKWFLNTVLIPNGIDINQNTRIKKSQVRKILFMARLHHKKGIIPLVKAWQSSKLFKNSGYELLVAGPDDGELENMNELLNKTPGNIKYLGAVYGEEKKNLLAESSFFILPSVSEGFPTSILEALLFGAVPIITEGCNFPELLKQNLGYCTSQNEDAIRADLDHLLVIDDTKLREASQKVQRYVKQDYSMENIAKMQCRIYKELWFSHA